MNPVGVLVLNTSTNDEIRMTIRPEHFSEIAARYGPPLVLFARQWCESAEDVVQEALLSLSEQRQMPDDVGAWLYRVTRNAAINASRSNRRRASHERRIAIENQQWFVESPSSQLDAEVAKYFLANLPLEQREIVIAKIWGGLTLVQIASISGVAVSTVHRRYQLAIAELRKQMSSSPGLHE